MAQATPVPTPTSFKFPKEDVDQLYTLMKSGILPNERIIPGSGWDLGISLEWLQLQRKRFETEFKWAEVEAEINRWKHFNVEIEGINLHFIHEKSKNPNALPLLLLHGWPGSFHDFHKVITPLTAPPDPTAQSFHVVIPSIPGYGKSSYPPKAGFTITDVARIYNTLMTTILGYQKYVGQGGDWGSHIMRIIGKDYAETVPLIHFNMFLGRAPPGWDLSQATEAERRMLARIHEFETSGFGYVEIQRTKPATIGYAIGTSPLALLTWIGEKFYSWSDPERLDVHDLFATVAIYFLTGTFPSSVLIYHQSRALPFEMRDDSSRWPIKSKIGFSAFPYEIGPAPREFISSVGDLVFYREHDHGGHFASLDNPEAFVKDIQDFVSEHWRVQ